MPVWKFKFHVGGTTFNSKQLEMEFEDKVAINRLFQRHPSSPDLEFSPTGVYSEEIKVDFLDPVAAFETNLMLYLSAETKPVFKKVTWLNKKEGQSHELDQKQIDRLNGK